MKGYKLTKSRKNNKIELYNYLFGKMRNYENNYDIVRPGPAVGKF